MYKALTSGKGLQHILDEASQLFKNPIMVYDTSMRNIAASRYGVQDDSLMNTILEERYIPVNNVKLAQRKNMMLEVLQGEKMSRICKVDFLKSRWISSQFEINGSVSGFVDVIEWCTPFNDDEDVTLHVVLREIIEYELSRDPNMRHSKGEALEYFLLHLLQADKTDPDTILQRANLLRLPVHNKWFILVARYPGISQQHVPSPHIKNYLELAFNGSISTIYQDSIILLVPADKGKDHSIPELKSMPYLVQNRRLSLGFSDCFTSILEIKEGYIEANKAIELGWRLSKDDKVVFYHYEKYRLYHALDIIAHHHSVEKFCDKRLLELMQYDEVNNTSYTSTLQCYLDMGFNIPATAKKLNIHRNTLDYRLKKIEQLKNIHIHSAENLFSIVSSFYILRYLDT